MSLPSVDPFLRARHRGDDYNCLHFARDVWLELTGDDIQRRLDALSEPEGTRHFSRGEVKSFARLPRRSDPCLVLMRRPRGQPHVGVYLRGRILHLTEQGARFDLPQVALQAFTPRMVRYYR